MASKHTISKSGMLSASQPSSKPSSSQALSGGSLTSNETLEEKVLLSGLPILQEGEKVFIGCNP
jgi:hypothetical protein